MPGTLPRQFDYCLNCFMPLKDGQRKYCSSKCKQEHHKKQQSDSFMSKYHYTGPNSIDEYIQEWVEGKTRQSYGMWIAEREILPLIKIQIPDSFKKQKEED